MVRDRGYVKGQSTGSLRKRAGGSRQATGRGGKGVSAHLHAEGWGVGSGRPHQLPVAATEPDMLSALWGWKWEEEAQASC